MGNFAKAVLIGLRFTRLFSFQTAEGLKKLGEYKQSL